LLLTARPSLIVPTGWPPSMPPLTLPSMPSSTLPSKSCPNHITGRSRPGATGG